MKNEDKQLLEEAIKLVRSSNLVSVSFVQRKLRIGYLDAARIVVKMEDLGVISKPDPDNYNLRTVVGSAQSAPSE